MYTKGKFISGTEDLTEIYQVRNQDTLYKVLNEKEEYDSCNETDDSIAVHVIAYCIDDESKPIAAGKIIFDGEEYRIDHVYTSSVKEPEVYKEFILKMLIYKAFQNGANLVYAKKSRSNFQILNKIGFVDICNKCEEIENNNFMVLKKCDQHLCCENN